jgi:hypothetical protein
MIETDRTVVLRDAWCAALIDHAVFPRSLVPRESVEVGGIGKK